MPPEVNRRGTKVVISLKTLMKDNPELSNPNAFLLPDHMTSLATTSTTGMVN